MRMRVLWETWELRSRRRREQEGLVLPCCLEIKRGEGNEGGGDMVKEMEMVMDG